MFDEHDAQQQTEMGARLRALREVLVLTQSAFGEIMGVGATTVAGWESGRNQIDIVKLARAAKHCGFSIDYIALGDLSGLKFALAMRLQGYFRNQQDEQTPRRKGRPAKQISENPKPLLLRDVPEPTHKAPAGLHERQAPFIPPPKHKK